MRFVLLCLFGFLIAAANMLPTFCGAIMALCLNLYERILHALSLRKGYGKERRLLLIPLGIGAVGALFALQSFTVLLAGVMLPVVFFTIGLILGGTPSVVRRIAMAHCPFSGFVVMGAAFLGMLLLDMRANTGVAFLQGAPPVLRLLVGGVLLGAVMLLPGAAGMKCVLLLGLHQPLFVEGITQKEQGLLLAVGCVAGVLLAARVFSFLFARFSGCAYCAVLGVMLGSLVTMINTVHFTLNMKGAIAIALFLFGMMLSLLMEKLRDFFLNRSALPVSTVAEF